jgi:hypothetical protein
MNIQSESEHKNLKAINSIEEARKFDELLVEYSKKHAIEHPSYLSLENCWERIQKLDNAGQIFTSVFDIKLSLVLLNYDIVEISDSEFKTREGADGKVTIFNQPINSFFARVNLHRSANAYILRYRAVFDKLMGLMVLIYSPKNYKKFLCAASRKKEFKIIASNYPKIFPIESISNLFKSISMFDDFYRTPEAHYSGKLRKYTFSFDKNGSEYFGKLQIDSWNYLISVIREIDKNIG